VTKPFGRDVDLPRRGREVFAFLEGLEAGLQPWVVVRCGRRTAGEWLARPRVTARLGLG
jgi:hypothetical protein